MIMNKVLYNIDQREDTREEDKARARANIGAAGMSDIPSVPSPSNSNPQPPGTASPGNSNDYSRANHVHPLQSIPDASSTTKGIVKLGSDTVQSEAAQSPSSTVGRTYSVQNDSNGKMVVNVPWTDASDASSTTKGIVKLGSDTVQSEAAQSPSSSTGRTYPVQNDSNGNMVVNVPWTDTQPTTQVPTPTVSDKRKFLHYDSEGNLVWDYIYKGTYTINIQGSHTDSTTFTEVVPEVLNVSQIEVTETWREVNNKASEGRPTVAFNKDGTMYLTTFGNCGDMQKSLNFFVSLSIFNHDGYDLTDEANWGHDPTMVQLVGGMSRGMPYCISDKILSHGIRLKHAKTSAIYTEFRITLVADYLYTYTGIVTPPV